MTRRLIVMGACAWLALNSSMGFAQTAMDWKGLEEAWNQYYLSPSEENAQKVLALLPSGGKILDIKDGFIALNAINDHLGVLEGEVYSGQANSVKLGFRLFTIAYGGFEVNLNKIMGNLIAFNPRMFLEELQAHRDLFPALEGLLGSYLRDTANDPTARDLEQKLRIKALESVEDKALKSMRNECIKILKKL